METPGSSSVQQMRRPRKPPGPEQAAQPATGLSAPSATPNRHLQTALGPPLNPPQETEPTCRHSALAPGIILPSCFTCPASNQSGSTLGPSSGGTWNPATCHRSVVPARPRPSAFAMDGTLPASNPNSLSRPHETHSSGIPAADFIPTLQELLASGRVKAKSVGGPRPRPPQPPRELHNSAPASPSLLRCHLSTGCPSLPNSKETRR